MLTLKIGRKKMKKFLPNLAKNLEGYVNFQNYMWIMINNSIKKYKKKNKIEFGCNPYGEDVFKVNTYKLEEDVDNEDFKIEWLVCDIQGINYEAELKEYKELDKFEATLKSNFEKNKKNFRVNKPTNLFSSLQKKTKTAKETVFDVVEKGVGQSGNKTIAQFLLELDILIQKIPPKNPNSKSKILKNH